MPFSLRRSFPTAATVFWAAALEWSPVTPTHAPHPQTDSGPGASSAPRALTVDLWHTLVYLEPEAEEAYVEQQVASAVESLMEGRPNGAAAVAAPHELARIAQEVAAHAAEQARSGESIPLVAQITEAARRADRQVDPARYVRRISELVGATAFQIAPGAIDVLRALRQDGWRVGVVSNTVGEPGAAFRPIAKRLGLDAVVETWVFSDEHPWTKPHPAIFQEALRRLATGPESAVHVGDSWFDIAGAQQAGLRAALLYTGLQRYGTRYQSHLGSPRRLEPVPAYRFARWEELPGLLAALG